jgi:signal transduction histidine kinase
MDIPLRTRLQVSFVGVALTGVAVTAAITWRWGTAAAEDFPLRAVLISVAAALVLGVALAQILAVRLSRRIQSVTVAAEQLEQGNLQARVPGPARAEQDEIKHLQVIFNEMATALQERDEQLRESHRQLAEMTTELQRWNADYLSMLEFITHELKNQIAAAKLNVLAVKDGYVGELNPEQREALDDVMHTVHRTEDMLLNYLNLSRIEKGELQVRARPVHLAAEVVQPVLHDLQARFRAREMHVSNELPPDLVTQADPTLLQTVYENLLTNAAKYGRAGGQVRLWGRPVNGMWELHVWNEGPGVAPEQRDELFGKFCRLAPPGEEARGTGLGLFIDREIVRQHGGEIRAESQAGSWIDFVFTLPRPDEILVPAPVAS